MTHENPYMNGQIWPELNILVMQLQVTRVHYVFLWTLCQMNFICWKKAYTNQNWVLPLKKEHRKNWQKSYQKRCSKCIRMGRQNVY